MATIRVWPNILPSGVSIAAYAEDGVTPIPAAGGAQVEDSEYYRNQRSLSRILDHDPLGLGGNPLVITSFASTTAASLNAAISIVSQRGGGRIVVPRGTYTITGVGTDRILPLSNVELVFEPGCVINSGSFSGSSIVIFIDTTSSDKQNIKIIGNGLQIVGDKSNPLNTQYLVTINNQGVGDICSNIVISDMHLQNSATDGLLVGGNAETLNERVVFERITATGSARNGGTVNQGSARFVDCHFDENGDGKAPQVGFDIELDDTPPGTPSLVVQDVEFERCSFSGNVGNGLYGQDSTKGVTVRIRVSDCEAHDNGGVGILMNPDGSRLSDCRAYRNGESGFHSQGSVTMHDCVARENTYNGFTITNGKERTVLADCMSSFNSLAGYSFSTFGKSSGETIASACLAFANHTRGFDLTLAQQARIVDCSSTLNGQEGIKLYGAQNCQVVGTSAMQNGTAINATYDNIVLEVTSAHNTVCGNTVRTSGSYHRGTVVVDATYTTLTRIKLAVHASKRDTNEYVGQRVEILSGTEAGALGWITAYDEVNQSATVAWDAALGAIPSSGTPSVVEIVGGRLHTDTVVSATATTAVLSEDRASSLDGAYSGWIHVVSGTGSGQRRLITNYNGALRRVTWSTSMSPVLDDTSVIEIVAVTKPRYGIRLEASAYFTLLHMNDAYYGGATGGVSDAGTSTNAANNRST